ncbi:MAG: hypothetical protein R3D69_08125 [Xanthobacteraceae bacterium]
MARALRNWLEASNLPTIIAGVLAALVGIAVVLVVGGYYLVTL